ncbi:Gfo/Idh/MocA family oxidoreductase [Halomonas sp. MCCC 1A17488]|uniref:Gfo/Idh/MocA family protein n=1 Tax=unclassified Halomonas TaxID=2609666 RepID=UPI0018D20C48|nr:MULTISPECIES: Gfo/Idh/MocA family oxidoreductase [unclassified Halomonas]MCE8016071.1 Gfo/Idh/MocA family oxidoreductase [Halomonas sp. MCCC 1A17488]MCG3239404.1 Gfo/Idh/MocA family oxidoreductase [Halomonas sp. MCCC 1A17488]QPP50666.1 Gfo/Idh/MocA family oxidoreductase [Halomonas sp. SS10-MC5]
MQSIKIGLVGVGKIARDQHLPALAGSRGYELVATADPHARHAPVPGYTALGEMLEAHPELEAVAICTPTHLRYSQARIALEQGRSVLLEKPPGATLSEVEDLVELAERQGRTLFAAWHSRFAPGVEQARDWLRDRRIRRVEIDWREDVRVWHPGQAWIWEPAGMGVFDPGINALSIITEILPRAFFLREARLWVPSNCQAPIAAALTFGDTEGTPIVADFDFRQPSPPIWSIHVETEAGRLSLLRGGCRLELDGQCLLDAEEREYPGLYARFAELVRQRRSDVDLAPLRHVADACLAAWREPTEPFIE